LRCVVGTLHSCRRWRRHHSLDKSFVVGSRDLVADDLVVAIPIFFQPSLLTSLSLLICLSLLLRLSAPHSVPVEALAGLGTVRLVAPHAMESRVIAANFALQELVRRLVEVHIAFKATAARFEAEQQPAGG